MFVFHSSKDVEVEESGNTEISLCSKPRRNSGQQSSKGRFLQTVVVIVKLNMTYHPIVMKPFV